MVGSQYVLAQSPQSSHASAADTGKRVDAGLVTGFKVLHARPACPNKTGGDYALDHGRSALGPPSRLLAHPGQMPSGIWAKGSAASF